MKFRLIIDKNRDEEVMVYAHAKTSLTEAIEQLVSESNFEPKVLLIFFAVFVAVYFAVWLTVYFAVKATSRKLNAGIK